MIHTRAKHKFARTFRHIDGHPQQTRKGLSNQTGREICRVRVLGIQRGVARKIPLAHFVRGKVEAAGGRRADNGDAETGEESANALQPIRMTPKTKTERAEIRRRIEKN